MNGAAGEYLHDHEGRPGTDLLEDHLGIADQDSKRGKDESAEEENCRDEVGETRHDQIPMQELPDKMTQSKHDGDEGDGRAQPENKLQRHGAVVKQRFARQSQRGQERVTRDASPALFFLEFQSGLPEAESRNQTAE